MTRTEIRWVTTAPSGRTAFTAWTYVNRDSLAEARAVAGASNVWTLQERTKEED